MCVGLWCVSGCGGVRACVGLIGVLVGSGVSWVNVLVEEDALCVGVGGQAVFGHAYGSGVRWRLLCVWRLRGVGEWLCVACGCCVLV